jgi:two-component system, LytTR family, sensor kinase
MKEPLIIKTFDSQGITHIKAETLLGSIKVFSHAEETIRVEVFGRFWGWQFWASQERLMTALEKLSLHIEQQNDTLFLDSALQNEGLNWFNLLSISFRIYVPQHHYYNTDLVTKGGRIKIKDVEGNHYFNTKAGEVELKNVKGEIKGKTAMGTIEARNCLAKIDVSTAAGTIEVTQSEGNMTFSTSAGTIELDNLMGTIDATTSAGTIEAYNISGTLKVSTAAGTIDIRGMSGNVSGFTGAGTVDAEIIELGDFVDLESEAGSITVRMPFTEGVNLDIEGSVIKGASFPNFTGVKKRNRIKGEANNGGKTVRLHSRYGSVSLNTQRGSFKTFSKTLKDPQFTLPPTFFNRDIQGILLSLAICIITTYGFSSISYFTIELFNPANELRAVYKGVFLNNIADGIVVMLTTYIFIKYIADRIEKNWAKYVCLIISVFAATLLVQVVIGILYWRTLDDKTLSIDTSNRDWSFVYILIPPVVACIYFFLWQRSKQITRKISEQEFQLISLEKLKTKAELDALQARINPHFLHNSLNSIAGLVHHDPDKAEQMTLLLSKLFRYTTGTKDQHFNSIKNELEIVKTYLAIEQVRFEDRLVYEVNIEMGLENKEIPRFLLQPIVENAIKHGISKLSTQGKINVDIAKKDNYLVLSVHDNGPAFSDTFFTGYGLQSIQDKLKLLYGAQASLTIQNSDYKQVIIKLPC